MKKILLSILAAGAVLAATPLSAQPAPAPGTPDTATYFAFLPAADRQTLVSKGELTSVGAKASDLVLAAKAPFAADLRGWGVAGVSVSIEGLFLFPRPAGDVSLGLYNAVNAVASMEGLEYYSVSRQRMEPLVLASWRVAGADKPAKVADPVFTAVPAFQKAVIFQKDNKLGEGYSEVTWKALPGGALAVTFKNLGPLTYGILPLVEPGNLQMYFEVIPLADKVAVYGVMEGKTAQLLGLERSKDESFRNRMRALASWLGARIATLK